MAKSNPNWEPVGQKSGRKSRSPQGFGKNGNRNLGWGRGNHSSEVRHWNHERDRYDNTYSYGYGNRYLRGGGFERGGYWSGYFSSIESQHTRNQSLITGRRREGSAESEEEKQDRLQAQKKKREEEQERKEEKRKRKEVKKITDGLKRKLKEKEKSGYKAKEVLETKSDGEEAKEPEKEKVIHDFVLTNEDFRTIGSGCLPETSISPEKNTIQSGNLLMEGLVSASDYIRERDSSSNARASLNSPPSSEPHTDNVPKVPEENMEKTQPKRPKRKATTEDKIDENEAAKRKRLEEATENIVQQLKPVIHTKDSNWIKRVIDCKTPQSAKAHLMSTLVMEHRAHLSQRLSVLRFLNEEGSQSPKSTPGSLTSELELDKSLFSFQEIDVNDLPEALISQIEEMIKQERPDFEESGAVSDDDEIQEVPIPPKPTAPVITLDTESEDEQGKADNQEDTFLRRQESYHPSQSLTYTSQSISEEPTESTSWSSSISRGNVSRCIGGVRVDFSRMQEPRPDNDINNLLREKFQELQELDHKEGLLSEKLANFQRELAIIRKSLNEIRKQRRVIIQEGLSWSQRQN